MNFTMKMIENDICDEASIAEAVDTIPTVGRQIFHGRGIRPCVEFLNLFK